jgi:hypothetical protein
MLPKKSRELPVPPRQDRKQGEPKPTDPEDRDLLVGEGGDQDASTPRRLIAGRLDWRRASETRFAYARSPRQSSGI